MAMSKNNPLEQSFLGAASDTSDSESEEKNEGRKSTGGTKSESESEYEDIDDSESDNESDSNKRYEDFQKELEQLKSVGLARFANSDSQMNKMVHSFQTLAKSAERYDAEMKRVINQWSDREEKVDTAAHLSLNKSLEKMNFKRYDPLEQRVFYKENGEVACRWDCAFICILGDDKDSGDERSSDDESNDDAPAAPNNVDADIDAMTERLKTISDVPIFTEDIQEVIYLVTMEKDMDKDKLEDISKRLFQTLDCINRTNAISDRLPWRIRSRILSQRTMKTCMVKVVVGGEEIDEKMKDYILNSGYCVLYRSGFHYKTVLV